MGVATSTLGLRNWFMSCSLCSAMRGTLVGIPLLDRRRGSLQFFRVPRSSVHHVLWVFLSVWLIEFAWNHSALFSPSQYVCGDCLAGTVWVFFHCTTQKGGVIYLDVTVRACHLQPFQLCICLYCSSLSKYDWGRRRKAPLMKLHLLSGQHIAFPVTSS